MNENYQKCEYKEDHKLKFFFFRFSYKTQCTIVWYKIRLDVYSRWIVLLLFKMNLCLATIFFSGPPDN